MNAANKKYTVLLLSAPIGSGHRLAAEALEQVLADNEAVHVVHGNIFDFFPHFVGTVFLKCYLRMLQSFPWMYKYMYKWGNQEKGSVWMKNVINGLLAKMGRSYLQKVNPDAVIATHATPAGIIGIYKKTLAAPLFLGAVITDFTIHKWWICDGVDTYFIADERLQKRLPPDADVQSYGIPVRRRFAGLSRQEARKKLGIAAQDKICLLLGGGEGLLPMVSIVNGLPQDLGPDFRIIAVTGHNQQLAADLRRLQRSDLTVHGFTEQLPEIMAASDMVISKAGGLTSAEVLVLGLHFIIYHPLPGQEEGNARFLQQYCHAVVAANIKDVSRYVREFYNHTEREVILGRPQAAEKICAYVLQHLKQN